MIWERIKLVARRAIAWWIDAFAVAAVIMVFKWVINAATSAASGGGALTGEAGSLYDILALAAVFYLYRVVVEGRWGTSLGKWSLKLEIITPHGGFYGAAIRNSWLALTALAAAGIPYVEPTLLVVLGLSALLIGRTPFDALVQGFVAPKADDPLEIHNPRKRL